MNHKRPEGEPSRRSHAVAAKRRAILKSALSLFSQFGFHGTSLDKVAEHAKVTKTNLLYYFPSKTALYLAVLQDILSIWLAPLKALNYQQEPLEAIRHYIRLKLEVSRDHPQASRLFCMEMIQGAPLLKQELEESLKSLVNAKSTIIARWIDEGKLAAIEPYHLIFMLWAATQHYADYASQVMAITGRGLDDSQFFSETVDNVQRMIFEGIRVR